MFSGVLKNLAKVTEKSTGCNFIKRDSSKGDFLKILRDFSEQN